ncbi:MAG TPA: PEP/pyruvate-binding domain-containing protein [Thermoleophilia bacterium]|nr:PEP/pyruvate-binding domain-containing protein [Thermoleophilia bacterium]
MKTPLVPFDSDALRANIASTAQDVVIPDRYQPLVDAVEGLYGVRAALVETVGEYFHAYRNADLLIEGFQTTLLRNWTHFEASDERATLFGLLADLVLGLLDSPLTPEQFSLSLRGLLMWCANAVSGPHGDAYDDSLAAVARALTELVDRQPAAFLERDALLRDLVERVAARPALTAAFFELYRAVLLLGYRRLEERLDVPSWATVQVAGLTDPAAVAERFDFLSGERLIDLIRGAVEAPGGQLLSPGFPLFSEMLGQAIDRLFGIDAIEDRFAVCLFFLKDDALGYRQKEAMVELLGVVKEMMQPDRRTDVNRILSRLTAFFRDRDNQFLLMRFKCYEAIGVAIGEASNVQAVDHLVEDVLSWRFQYPDIQGATDEWGTMVNPYHLPKIRCWMRIIESNPALYERLAAALNVQLRLGGVYIADTDLFQRDVTRFLNADIGPIYFVAKQLLRTLPVYFNEVGAEGELRTVSTDVDEIAARRDSLVHFLRKQLHAESSNRMVDFSRAVLRYWATLDPSGLEPFVSANTMDAVRLEQEWARGPHEALLAWQRRGGGRPATSDEQIEELLERLVAQPAEILVKWLARPPAPAAAGAAAGTDATSAAPDAATEAAPDAALGVAPEAALEVAPEAALDAAPDDPGRRVALMVRTYQLLASKYSLAADEVGHAVDGHLALEAKSRHRFQRALTAWQRDPTPARRDRLLDAALGVLEGLEAIILDPAVSTSTENIYQKRHIAAGIPSIYGNYSEPKFDALGLSFRVESLVDRLFDDLVAEGIEPYVTRDSLSRMSAAMGRFERALAIDGVDSRVLETNLNMLNASFGSHNFTFRQYQNVFQFLVNSVTELSTNAILSHDQVLHTVLINDTRQCEARSLSVDAVAEMVLREVLVSALGMQALDRYAAAALRRISLLNGRLGSQALTRMMNYDPERLVSPLHHLTAATDDQQTLGFKGLGLKQMASYGHNVPEGFVLSTELFSAMPAMSYRPLYDDTIQRIGTAVGQLERATGLRLGDPGVPLLLSIRSGAAVSMPGLMTTFVNVGLNDEVTEALAEEPRFDWAAWDCYRRFLQSWAMASGIDRDFFDAIMTEFKDRHGVEQKIDFTPEQMRDIAFTYKDRARQGGVMFVDDPFAQVVSCVFKVLESWDSPHARLYRQYLGVAEEWGTAVVVQRMVFGNLTRESGSGVTFTHNPLEPYSRQVRLFGDFAVRSQGEDLVGGLVFPLPVSEAQRLGSPTYRGTEHSLERDYPDVYGKLLEVAQELVGTHEYDPQEIEFTFESPAADDLYVLQKRAVVHGKVKESAYFDTSSPNYGPPVAVGMGVAGGAYSGRVAIDAGQIDQLLAESPTENIVLLRPDTVPEDIAIITRVNAILTARGGATSHAAVTAKRLGKTAVVDCRDLEVIERQGVARLSGSELRAGDWLSIDGRTGNIFAGRIPTLAQPALPEPAATPSPAGPAS